MADKHSEGAGSAGALAPVFRFPPGETRLSGKSCLHGCSGPATSRAQPGHLPHRVRRSARIPPLSGEEAEPAPQPVLQVAAIRVSAACAGTLTRHRLRLCARQLIQLPLDPFASPPLFPPGLNRLPKKGNGRFLSRKLFLCRRPHRSEEGRARPWVGASERRVAAINACQAPPAVVQFATLQRALPGVSRDRGRSDEGRSATIRWIVAAPNA